MMPSFCGPIEVRGKLETLRNILQPMLLLIFLFLPWIKFKGEPLVLLDISKRYFVLLGTSFYSHDAPLLFFILILILLGIFTLTAIFGRIWCGWACPQTVFLHSVFNRLEKLILGSSAKRTLFYREVVSTEKAVKYGILLSLFFFTSWIISHSLLAYFVSAENVLLYVTHGPREHLKIFIIINIISVILFLNFTFFREKLCFFVCPYGRFQNALIDRNTVVVKYDEVRGEPRTLLKNKNPESGECIDCHLCYKVCPTKIDIRKGFQLECIACGKCIDACNQVMLKTNQRPNLIRYETMNQKKIQIKRFRLVLYVALFAIFFAALISQIYNRGQIDFTVSRSVGNPFSSRFENGKTLYVNQFRFHLKNQSRNQIRLKIEIQEPFSDFKLLTPAQADLSLAAEQDLQLPAFLECSACEVNQVNVAVQYEAEGQLQKIVKPLVFIRTGK